MLLPAKAPATAIGSFLTAAALSNTSVKSAGDRSATLRKSSMGNLLCGPQFGTCIGLCALGDGVADRCHLFVRERAVQRPNREVESKRLTSRRQRVSAELVEYLHLVQHVTAARPNRVN